MDTRDDRPRYQSSGKVDWVRLFLLGPILLATCAAIAWCLSWMFMKGWYYRIITPVVASLFVGAAARWVIGLAHCRNKITAGFIGGMRPWSLSSVITTCT